MLLPSYQRVSFAKVNGWLKGEVSSLIPEAFFDDPFSSVREMGGKVIQASRIRWSAIVPFPQGQTVFLKSDRTKDWMESIKYLVVPSKGRKEWFVAYQAQKRNLPIPKPLGWLERLHRGFVQESYYMSEAIVPASTFLEGIPVPVEELAKTVKKIHLAGLFHKDLHAGNFLWDGKSLYLVDLHNARIVQSLSLNRKLYNLSMLFHSLRSAWGEAERSLFVDVYFEGESRHLRKKEELLKRIDFYMNHLQQRQWQSRTKRCLKESSEFSVQRSKGFRYYHRRDFHLDEAKKLIEDHLRLVNENPSALAKNAPGVSVSLLENEGKKVCVKQIRNLNSWRIFKDHFRRHKGLRAWVGSNGLRARGIPSLDAFALLEKRKWLGLKESFFLMASPETGWEMDRYILERLKDPQKKRLFIEAFAHWLCQIHQKKIYHQDMKTCNILIAENEREWMFYLLDQEDISFDENVDTKKLLKSFLQLNTSTPRTISRTDRLRFLKQYLRENPILSDPHAFIQELTKESQRQGIVYVTSQGVAKESF